jgi:hypothetical protein
MPARGVVLASLCLTLSVFALAGGVPTFALDDGNGKVWRQVTDTTGVTAAELPSGETRMSSCEL